MVTNKISFRVRYGETDQMGVVYHGNYAQYLEMARIEWLRDLGISYKELEASGVMLPVVNLSVKYLKPAMYDDILTVIVKLKKIPTVRIIFDYEILNQNGELLSEANTVLAFMDGATKRPIRCPKSILSKIVK